MPTFFCHTPCFLRNPGQILHSLWLNVSLNQTETILCPTGNRLASFSLPLYIEWMSDGFLLRAYITLYLYIINLLLSFSDPAFVIVQVISIILSCESCKQALPMLQSVLRFINMFKAAASQIQWHLFYLVLGRSGEFSLWYSDYLLGKRAGL